MHLDIFHFNEHRLLCKKLITNNRSVQKIIKQSFLRWHVLLGIGFRFMFIFASFIEWQKKKEDIFTTIPYEYIFDLLRVSCIRTIRELF